MNKQESGIIRIIRNNAKLLISAFLIQCAILLVAVYIVVFVPKVEEKTTFVGPNKIVLPQKQQEHQAAFSEFQSAVNSSFQPEKISVENLLISELPDFPTLAANDVSTNIDSYQLTTSENLLGQSGLLAEISGSEGQQSSASLFGIQDSGERILILFDNSASVWNKARKAGVSKETFVDELTKLIRSLNANTKFALVPFSRSVGTFKDYMVAGSSANKDEAVVWITQNVMTQKLSTQFVYDADGIEGALYVARELEPDLIYLISDADFQRNRPTRGDVPWKDVERQFRALNNERGDRPRVNFIGFEVEAGAAAEMGKLIRRFDGKIRTF